MIWREPAPVTIRDALRQVGVPALMVAGMLGYHHPTISRAKSETSRGLVRNNRKTRCLDSSQA